MIGLWKHLKSKILDETYLNQDKETIFMHSIRIILSMIKNTLNCHVTGVYMVIRSFNETDLINFLELVIISYMIKLKNQSTVKLFK